MGGRGTSAERNSRSSNKFVYERDPNIKEWSTAEDKRNVEISKKLFSMLNQGDWEEFYEENFMENIKSYKVSSGEVTVDKMNLVYSQNYDENDRRVKQGKVVTGTTYYVVQTEDGSIDETHFAYKTKEDAIHAAELYVDRLKKYNDWKAKGR